MIAYDYSHLWPTVACKRWRSAVFQSAITTCVRALWLPIKISFFSWRVWHCKLPLDDILTRLGYTMPSRSWCCNRPTVETMQYLFLKSQCADKVWQYFSLGAGLTHGVSLQQARSVVERPCKCISEALISSIALCSCLGAMEEEKEKKARSVVISPWTG